MHIPDEGGEGLARRLLGQNGRIAVNRLREFRAFLGRIGRVGEAFQNTAEDFAGGFPHERHRQDILRFYAVEQKFDVAVRQPVGLSGTGRGADDQIFVPFRVVGTHQTDPVLQMAVQKWNCQKWN